MLSIAIQTPAKSMRAARGTMCSIKKAISGACADAPASRRLLVTAKSEISTGGSSGPKISVKSTSGGKLKEATKPRRLATSARVWPDGFVKPALYDEDTPIPRCEAYPTSYFTGSFPWLLSAERQRIPMSDLEDLKPTSGDMAKSNCKSIDSKRARDGDAVLARFAQWLPIAARRRLAHTLNTYIARQALGQQAMDEVCAGAAMVLPSVARLLSSISSGKPDGPDMAGSLAAMFSPPLLARFSADLARLRRDNVQLALEVRRINSARIHQIRTQTGPVEAFESLTCLQTSLSPQSTNTGGVTSSLRAGLVRQAHRFSNMLGVTHAAPTARAAGFTDNGSLSALSSWAGGVWAASQGCTDVGVRVDVELNVDMRYRLIGCHSGPSEYDRHNGTSQVIVDDDATRNLMLTLESTHHKDSSEENSKDSQSFVWRVADIDYLLSSEMRIQHELDEARNF